MVFLCPEILFNIISNKIIVFKFIIIKRLTVVAGLLCGLSLTSIKRKALKIILKTTVISFLTGVEVIRIILYINHLRRDNIKGGISRL